MPDWIGLDWMGTNRAVSEGWKVWIAGGAAVLAIVQMWLPRRIVRGLLLALVLIGGVTYARFGLRVAAHQVDGYDVLHYYLNAKYFDELGYFDLYPACVQADHEEGGPYFDEGNRYLAQDESGHHLEPIGHAVARGRELRDTRFTPERWSSFKHDFVFLQRTVPGLSDTLWRQLLQDHGFNGTPVWTLLARPVASVVPVEGIKVLGYLDVGLVGAALVVLARVSGAETAGWVLLFLWVTYSGRWPTYSTAFLRYDWLAALLFAYAALRSGRPMLAGALSGWAATLRLFPALWLILPGLKGVAGLLRREVSRPLLRLAAGFLLAVALLQGAAVLAFGAESVGRHLRNMSDHNSSEQLSSRRIGLATALPYRGQITPKNITSAMKEEIEAQRPLRFGLAAVVMLLFGLALRRARDEQAFALGFLPFFLLTTASYYYYVARATLVVSHADGARGPEATWRDRIGLALLFGIEAFCNLAETRLPDHRVFLIGWLSWLLAAYTLLMLGFWLVDAARKPAVTTPG